MSKEPKSYCCSEVIHDLLISIMDFLGYACLWLVKSNLGSMFNRGMSHSASTLNLTLSNVLHIWNSYAWV